MKNETIHERIQVLVEHFGDGKNTVLASKLGVSEGNIRGYTKATLPKLDFLEKVVTNLEVSAEWLLTGNGCMLKNSEDTPNITLIHHPKSVEKKHEKQAVNLYDFKASAGLRELFDNRQADIIDTISIPNMPKCDGAIYVSGDSMIPVLKSGDIVLYKEFRLSYDSIIFGEMYLLSYALDESTYLTVVKYVRKSPKGEGYITLSSENPNHADRDIEFRRINAIALVQASIRINTMM